jgi:hypothetical protein
MRSANRPAYATTTTRSGRGDPALAAALRVVGAALLGTMAGIHLHLYNLGFRSVPKIGPSFMLNAVLGAVFAVALLVTPRRWLALASLAGAGLLAGTLAALVISLTVGLFDFHETLQAPLIWPTIAVEGGGALLLLGYAIGDGWPRLRAWRGDRAAHR